ncbi:MAG: NAD(P)H-binding protein [Chitinophagaceae bacterium]
MKIIVTGSLGHISRPLTVSLLQKGHTVTVISSNPEKIASIEALGATAAIGSLEDRAFLISSFTGADAVYCMVPPNNYFDPTLDLMAYYGRIAGNYTHAIQAAGVKRVVYLSSIGAHLEKESGIIMGHHKGEAIMNTMHGIAVTCMRPVAFYYNLYGYVNMIKSQGVIAANYGADDKDVWVAPEDIAAAIADELELPAVERKVRYVASDELTGNEAATILGAAIGKPDLKWIIISSEQMQAGLEAAGIQPGIAAGLVEMYEGVHSGIFFEDYYRNRPAVMGKIKFSDFAKEFAAAFR